MNIEFNNSPMSLLQSRCHHAMCWANVEEWRRWQPKAESSIFIFFYFPSHFSLSLSVQCHFCSFLRLNEISIMCAWWCWLRRWLTLHTASFVVTAVVLANTKHWHVYAKSCASVWRSAAVIIIFFHCVNSFFFFHFIIFCPFSFSLHIVHVCAPHTNAPFVLADPHDLTTTTTANG